MDYKASSSCFFKSSADYNWNSSCFYKNSADYSWNLLYFFKNPADYNWNGSCYFKTTRIIKQPAASGLGTMLNCNDCVTSSMTTWGATATSHFIDNTTSSRTLFIAFASYVWRRSSFKDHSSIKRLISRDLKKFKHNQRYNHTQSNISSMVYDKNRIFP